MGAWLPFVARARKCALFVFPPPQGGGGGPPEGRWRGRQPHGSLKRRMPPPPRFAWSPSPALRAGADKGDLFSRRVSRPSLVDHHNAKEDSLPQEGAERRKAHVSHCRTKRGCALLAYEARPPFGAHAAALATGYYPRWLSPRTGFPANEPCRVFCPLGPHVCGLARSVRTGLFAGRPGTQGRPGADGISAARAPHLAPLFRLALPEGALCERGAHYVTETETICQDLSCCIGDALGAAQKASLRRKRRRRSRTSLHAGRFLRCGF